MSSINVVLVLCILWIRFVVGNPQSQCAENGCGVGCSFLCDFGSRCVTDSDCFSKSCLRSRCNFVAPSVVLGNTSRPLRQTSLATIQPDWIGTITPTNSFSNWNITWSYGRSNVRIVVDPLQGTDNVIRALYPQNSFKPSSNPVGGFGLSAAPLDLTRTQKVTLEYQVFFPRDFEFNKGGKLPGLFGGEFGCSGGDSAKDCFSARFMWRQGGLGETYMYVNQAAQNRNLCRPPFLVPNTICNPEFGISVARGGFTFIRGSWNFIRQTIRLNSFSGSNRPVEDGELTVYHNGNLSFSLKNIVFRLQPRVTFIGIDVETFFGGNTRDFASPKNQFSYLKGFRIYVE